jgi:hypothetical protein
VSEYLRATFEDVIQQQQTIRDKLTELINNNKTLDNEEREKFQNKIARACLGLETEVTATIRHPVMVPKKRSDKHVKTIGVLFSGTLAELITETVYMDEPVKKFQTSVSNYPVKGVGVFNISKLWDVILKKLEDVVFPQARNLSLQVSPEREEKGGKHFGGPRD